MSFVYIFKVLLYEVYHIWINVISCTLGIDVFRYYNGVRNVLTHCIRVVLHLGMLIYYWKGPCERFVNSFHDILFCIFITFSDFYQKTHLNVCRQTGKPMTKRITWFL